MDLNKYDIFWMCDCCMFVLASIFAIYGVIMRLNNFVWAGVIIDLSAFGMLLTGWQLDLSGSERR